MSSLRKFLRLPGAEKRLLLAAWLLLGRVRLGLKLLSFPRMRQIVARKASRTGKGGWLDPLPADRVVWAVQAAGRYVPGGGNCLAQALCAKILLGSQGHVALLRIGVARNEEGKFQAHAWIESEERILIGDLDDLKRFTLLPPLDGEEL